MHYLPKGPKVAGGQRNHVPVPPYQGAKPHRRGAQDLVQTQRPAAEEVLQHQRLLYKELGLKDKLPKMNDEEQLALLASDGMLVKRPVLVGDDFVLVGFRVPEWTAALGLKPLTEEEV